MNFREFKHRDKEFCFTTRATAFIKYFYREIGEDNVAYGINAILPDDYIQLSIDTNIFIIEDNGQDIGFITIKRVNKTTAEIPLIYFTPESLGKGYGSRSMNFIETWCKTNWKEVKKIYLDTIIPKYNGGFYERISYRKSGDSSCIFNNIKVPAVRFIKNIQET